MLSLLLVLFGLVSACVAVHGIGLTLGFHSLGRSWREPEETITPGRTLWLLVRVVFGLLVLHLLQILVWAAFYQGRGCFPEFETSFYYSATSYSTVGYGDVIPPREWRILGSVEAVTGVLMFGWSTGVLFAVAQAVHARYLQPRLVRRDRA